MCNIFFSLSLCNNLFDGLVIWWFVLCFTLLQILVHYLNHTIQFVIAICNSLIISVTFVLKLEEAKLLRAQGQHELAINLAEYISQNHQLKEEAADVYRLVGKWLAETRSSKLVICQYYIFVCMT